jgi:hypothetical protein
VEEPFTADDPRVGDVLQDLSFDDRQVFCVLALQLDLDHFFDGILLAVDGGQEDAAEGPLSYFVFYFEVLPADLPIFMLLHPITISIICKDK